MRITEEVIGTKLEMLKEALTVPNLRSSLYPTGWPAPSPAWKMRSSTGWRPVARIPWRPCFSHFPGCFPSPIGR